MASQLETDTARYRRPSHEDAVAVIEEADLVAARKDPRVAAFLEESDAYLADLERQGRNR